MTDEWSDEEWDATYSAIRAVAHEILAEGPLALDELTVMLAERGALAAFDGCELDELEEIVDEASSATDDTWMSDRGTLCLTRELLQDVVLTHRVTAGELERGPVVGFAPYDFDRLRVKLGLPARSTPDQPAD